MPPLPLALLLDNVGAPIGSADPKYATLLKDLQANILSSHGKPSAEYFFLEFREKDSRARQLLGLLASDKAERAAASQTNGELRESFPSLFGKVLANVHVSSEWQVSGGGSGQRTQRDDAVPFPLLVMLTARGYAKLGEQTTAPDDPAFSAGMAARGDLLNDPAQADWDKGYAGTKFDALVILAFDSEDARYEKTIAALAGLLAAFTTHREQGFTRRGWNSDPVEPFGFRDNLSQPIFYASGLSRVRRFQGKAAEPRGNRWRSFEPLKTVLVADPGGKAPHACGTYVVFRKLRQDVDSFTNQVNALATKLDRSPGEVAADLFGRTREGWPLAATPNTDDMNDFDFSADSGCPLHAHIRKANPRNANYAPHERRIVRRGLTYQTAGEGGETGLLFLCKQSNIAKQFEATQRWMNDTLEGGADPIAGQPRTTNRIALKDRNGVVAGRIHAFERTVSMKGGDYFFMPSLSALKALLR